MLNNNKLVTLGKEMLNGLSHLRTLKLADNAFACDCHLAWLSRHLRNYPRLGQHTRCASPAHLKDRNLADVQVSLTEELCYHLLNFPVCKNHKRIFLARIYIGIYINKYTTYVINMFLFICIYAFNFTVNFLMEYYSNRLIEHCMRKKFFIEHFCDR